MIALAPRFEPRAESLRLTLPDLAEGLHAQLYKLFEHPAPDAAERLSVNLAGAARALLRYREAMLREGRSDDQ